MFQLGDNVKNVSSSIYDYAGYTVGAGEIIVASTSVEIFIFRQIFAQE